MHASCHLGHLHKLYRKALALTQHTTHITQHTTHNTQQATHNIQQTTNNKQQTPNNKQQPTNNTHQTTNNTQRPTHNKQQTTNNTHYTTNKNQHTQHTPNNTQHTTTNIQRTTTNNQHTISFYSDDLAKCPLLRSSGTLHGGAAQVAASFALMPPYRLTSGCVLPAVRQPAVVALPQPVSGALQTYFASICMRNWAPSFPRFGKPRWPLAAGGFQLARRPSFVNRSRAHAFHESKAEKATNTGCSAER
jgi:hypothetical protein